jgi:hypothetical protein
VACDTCRPQSDPPASDLPRGYALQLIAKLREELRSLNDGEPEGLGDTVRALEAALTELEDTIK